MGMNQPGASQKALDLDDNFRFRVSKIEIPEPDEHEVLIKVSAAALNPGDWKIQRWGIKFGGRPVVPGMDTAGIVEKIGKGVHGFQLNDRVITMGTWTRRSSAFQQYMCAEARFTAKVPQEISDEESASVPVGALAAWIGLYNHPHGAGHPHPFNDAPGIDKVGPLLVIGGSSSVGQYVIQFAKMSNFSPIITTASLWHANFLKELGATHVLNRDRTNENLISDISDIVKGSFPIVFDAISSADTKRFGHAMLATGGKLLTVDTRFGEFTTPPPESDFVPLNDEEELKSIIPVRGVTVDPETSSMAALLFQKLYKLLETKVILPNRVELLPGGLDAIAPGLARLEHGMVSGIKLVIRPQETP
ncbi:hypothetical protein GYMLUDRAFT_50720 [Collybiopsis luxurians FD-317 M1]|uniref:Enoyl reductase (ER) domain-containing protein n=1 Tax=Collybiopsis luxurians FD-317 M1 TaxID=944289 RepID=A0A0D0ALP7_9AGAR|nr:hypothetical protein GYMLUDRAFT_50720 [Collybiopsis luxurians FD-317 M1]